MTKKSWLTMVMAVALVTGSNVSGELTSVVLEQAIHAEETSGDLDKAISLYEKIIADTEAQRSYTAQAHYRLALCYLKKGQKAKAVDKLKQLPTQYSDQQKVVADAKAQLAKLDSMFDGPIVLKTTPACYQEDVDSSLKVLTVTFDREMMDKSWSWCGSGETLPETTGQPHYDKTRRTCSLPVILEPGRVYLLRLNNQKFKNFQTPTQQPAKDYVLLFATKSSDGRPTAIPEDIKTAAAAVNTREDDLAAGTNQSGVLVAEPPKLEPAPWTDGEVMHLSLKTGAGIEIGDARWSAESVNVDGKALWRIEQYLTISVDKSLQYSRVDAEKDSFVPVYGRTKNKLGDCVAVYGNDSINLSSDVAGQKSSRQISKDSIMFDNEQALYVIRRLPLAEKYSTAFNIFPVQGGQSVKCTIAVTGMEKQTVPAGSFDCYKLKLAVYSDSVMALQHTLWISADKKKLLVKYDSNNAVMNLVEVTSKNKEKNVFEDKELGVSVNLPAGWQAVKNASAGAQKLDIQLVPPEIKAWSVFTAAPVGGIEMLTVRGLAEKDIGVLKGYFKDYTVRPASWKMSEIGGVPAATFVADYKDKSGDQVEYRTYLLGKSHVYWFVFRTGKADLESQKADFDSIVGSFKGK